MALSMPFIGSGHFVARREWSCSKHSSPWNHECDCPACEREWDCDECATAEWRDVLNADGTPEMRELSKYEFMLRQHVVTSVPRLTPSQGAIHRVANGA